MTSDTDNRRGAVLMMVAMGAFTINDAFMKEALTQLPLGQSLFLRGLAASLFTALITWHGGGFASRPNRSERRAIGLRTIGEIGGTGCFMVALSHMPLADLTAILQALPLFVTLAAAVFLRETVGWRRWSAILMGFSGVLLIVQPGGSTFSPYALLALLAVVFITLRDLSTRRIAGRMSSALIAHITALAVTALGIVLLPFAAWEPVTWGAILPLMGSAIFLSAGYLTVVAATRTGDIGFVAPFRYTGLVWAIVLGLVFFAEIPSVYMLSGAAIIVAAGLYAFWRERQLRDHMRKGAANPATPLTDRAKLDAK
tara:strand:+ start:2159 stop:3097 length:939 start_codon:yes stop_codon:yes gene_type:complete